MKTTFYKALLLYTLIYLTCVIEYSLYAQNLISSPQNNTINDNEISSQKRRRRSRSQRLQDKQQIEPASKLINANHSPQLVNQLHNNQVNPSTSTELSPSELTQTFMQQEDTESHLLAEVSSLRPKEATKDLENTISVNLDKTELLNVMEWIEKIFKIKILSGDSVNPAVAGKIAGNLITYKNNKPMTKHQIWDLFLTFLDLIGLTLVPNSSNEGFPNSYTVMQADSANQAALPSFVGIDWQSLPNNDTKIRFVYFVENGPASNLSNLVQDLKSKAAIVQTFNALNAIIFTDKAANIRSLMAIISELDSVSMPEAMSVLKLKHANAQEVVALYQSLVSGEEKTNIATRLFGQKKQPTAVYFPEDTQLFAEERSNALIILGNKEGITKVENFILDYIDTKLKQPYSPLYVYKLQYANADNIAAILNKVTNFAPNTAAAKYGGVLGGDQYFRPMTFISEPSGNKLLIKAEKEDYLKVREIIKKLDIKQPQVAIEVLIVSVATNKVKSLGTQLRNKTPDTLGISDNIAFQTSGLGLSGNQTGIVVDQNGGLMGNLVSLASGFSTGTTLISIGNNLVGGVWALFQALETYTFANVVSHPFLTATNKYTAQVSVGETRRVSTGTVTGAGPTLNSQGDVSANLSVAITPQINSDGIINLTIELTIDSFTSPDANSPTVDRKIIKTNANLANNEILAIGGILQDTMSEIQTGVPLLQNIPGIGWLFKNKTKVKAKDNLIAFISPQIVLPRPDGGVGHYTEKKAVLAQDDMCAMRDCSELRDPINRWFFRDYPCENSEAIDDFISNQSDCNAIKGYNCRTGQQCEYDSICTDMARCCPNNKPECAVRCECPQEHVTPICIPECPRPCSPPPCPNQYAMVDDENKLSLQQENTKKVVALNQASTEGPLKPLARARKQSITDFLTEKKEVVT